MLHFPILKINFYSLLYSLCVSVLNSLPQVEVDAHTHTPLVAETSMDNGTLPCSTKAYQCSFL